MTVKVVAVMGAVGGAGSTTVAAQLAAALGIQKRPVLGIDFCPENLLRLHFGMAWNDGSGFAANLMSGHDWHTAAYRSNSGLDFVPFGLLRSDDELERLAGWFKQEPDWFREQLSAIQAHPDTIVVCDCPRIPAPLAAQALSAADLVLLVMPPDTVSYALATRMAHSVAAQDGPETMIVLNGFDPMRRMDRDIAVLLRSQHRSVFSPVVVHRDESLREALACKQSIFDFAPSAQSAYEFAALATWTVAHLGQAQGMGMAA